METTLGATNGIMVTGDTGHVQLYDRGDDVGRPVGPEVGPRAGDLGHGLGQAGVGRVQGPD